MLRSTFRAARLRLPGCRGLCGSPLGTVMSFGDGSHGALGLPSAVGGLGGDAYEPTLVPGLPSDVSAVSAGHYHSLAVTASGEVWAWGRNNEAQLGRGLLVPSGSWNEPKKVEGLDHVKVRVAFASGVISAAVGYDGSLWVWGKSKRGQLGIGKEIVDAVLPARVQALAEEKIVKASFGWGHALALTEDGRLFGWGYSAEGRLGHIGRAPETTLPNPVVDLCTRIQQVEIAEQVVLEAMELEKKMAIIWEPCLFEELRGVVVIDMACGLDHSLVLCRDGTLLSGGADTYGQLGRETQEFGLFQVDLQPRPMSVAAGLGHSLAICGTSASNTNNLDRRLMSWGWNRSSQLGRSGREDAPSVVEGLEGETPVSVSGGRVHSLALTSEGELWAWGCGKNGRLGLGHSADELTPVSLGDVEVLQAVSGFDHNLILVAE